MYKLKINGFNAEFNGIKKGTIRIAGTEYQWSNLDDYIINYDFSQESNVIAFQDAPVWSSYTGEKAIYKRQSNQNMSWYENEGCLYIGPNNTRYGLYWSLPVGEAKGKITEEFKFSYRFWKEEDVTSKVSVGNIFHNFNGNTIDGCRISLSYDPTLTDGKYQWTWRTFYADGTKEDILISNESAGFLDYKVMDFRIEYDFEDTKEIKVYIGGVLVYTDTTSIDALALSSLTLINNSICNNGTVKDNVREQVYNVSVY